MLDDFKVAHWYQRTWPGSHFVQSPFCTLFTDDGMITLAGRRLITTEGTTRHEEEFESDEQVLAAYRKLFGLDLDRVPTPPSQASFTPSGAP